MVSVHAVESGAHSMGCQAWELVREKHALSYTDCFAAATVLKHNATIVTGDPEFKEIEHLVEIDWI